MPVTTGMKGAGFYDQHSTAQLASIQLVLDWIENAIAAMPWPAGSEPFTVLDLGSSEGRNALVVMKAVIESVRQRQADRLIQTLYSDLPSNNFNQLFANLQEARRQDRTAGVYPSAVAGSFYEPLRPPGTVHLATSFNAVLWLDRLPDVPLSGYIVYRRPHPPRPGLNVPPETTEAFSRRADEDWSRFLQ
jgi:hypothetical protein